MVKNKENKKLVSFSIEPTFKDSLVSIFNEMGLSWSSGVRMALKDFERKYQKQERRNWAQGYFSRS